jgi:hypothetical protein
MALIYFGTGTAGDGDTLYDAFVKINGIIGVGSGTATYSLKVGNGLEANTTGVSNTALGQFALFNNTTGISNTGVGTSALQSNTTGNYNTVCGIGASTSTIASNVTSVGYAALGNNTASNNTAIGYGSLNGNTTFTNVTGLGANAQVSASNQVRLGDTSVTTLTSSGTASFSDIRDKSDIRDTVLGLDFVNSLRAVDYKWDYREDYKSEMPSPLNLDASEEEKDAYKIIMDEWLESCKFSNLVHDGSKKRTRYHHGLIAQEVKSVIEESGVDFGGFQDHTIGGGDEVMTVTYTELIAPMIKAIQELTARINVLEGL